MLLAVLLLVGKVAKCLFPKTGLLFPIQLTNLHYLPVLPILHVVMHDLLETEETRDTIKGQTRVGEEPEDHQLGQFETGQPSFPFPSNKGLAHLHSQFVLLVEVKDPILEIMHLAQDQGLIKDLLELSTLQQENGFTVQLLFDLGRPKRTFLDVR